MRTSLSAPRAARSPARWIWSLTGMITAALVILGPVSTVNAAPVAGVAANANDSTPAGLLPPELIAIGQSQSYFTATVTPGETTTLQIERVNPNSVPLTAHTYVGMVSTLVNGGFGASSATDVMAGASSWVKYPEATIAFTPNEHDTTAIPVTVPAGTAPGEYISSIVIENSAADPGSGKVAVGRLVRHAIAISIRVPGILTPSLSLQHVAETTTSDRTVVSVSTVNTGNEHLRLSGSMTVEDSQGRPVSTNTVTMGTFYAFTSTSISVPLAGALTPGDYFLSMTLTDPTVHLNASLTRVRFTVPAPPVTDRVLQALAPLQKLLRYPPDTPPWFLLLGIAGALTLVVCIVVVLLRLRRPERRQKIAGLWSRMHPTARKELN